jgi:hypothetical protein
LTSITFGLVVFLLTAAPGPPPHSKHWGTLPAKAEVFAPEKKDNVGIAGAQWIIDLAVEFEDVTLAQAGFTGAQLTGPAGHNDIPPFPGTFSVGADDRFPGLVVLLSTTTVGAGPGQNLANLFNVTGVNNVTPEEVEIWDTWLIGAPNFGVGVDSTLYVAVIADRDENGVFDDAPDVVPDADGDGDVDGKDLEALGLASRVAKVDFFINP